MYSTIKNGIISIVKRDIGESDSCLISRCWFIASQDLDNNDKQLVSLSKSWRNKVFLDCNYDNKIETKIRKRFKNYYTSN